MVSTHTRNRAPTRAMVLAAGLGSRLQPLTADVPKPLLPLWNRPLIFRTLDLLGSWGVRDVRVNLHHGADRLAAALRGTSFPGLTLSFSFEPVRLETGGALRRAAAFFDAQPFWLINADVAADLDPRPLVAALAGDPDALAAVWVTDVAGPRTVEVKRGRVVGFRSPRAGAPGTFTFCGLHLVRPAVLRFVPREERISIVRVYEAAQRRGWSIRAVQAPGSFWADLGTPEQVVAAHAAVRRAFRSGLPGARLYDPAAERSVGTAGWVCAADDAKIERGARVRDCVLLSGACVRRGAEVHDALVGPSAEVRGPAARLIVRAAEALAPSEAGALAGLGFDPAATSLEALPPRGSDRAFFRLRLGARRLLLVRWSAERTENARWSGHARFLDVLGLRVPRIHADLATPAGGSLLIEDAGYRTLRDEWSERSMAGLTAFLGRVIARVVRLHEEGPAEARAAGLATEPGFGAALYRFEHSLFTEGVLRDRLGWTPVRAGAVERELGLAAEHLAQEPEALLHRDLQSSNLLRAGREPLFIDFQGMRPGPAVYDLASLLYDPYVRIPPVLREALVTRYARESRRGAAAVQALPWGAVQRLVQAMGAYARLESRYGLSEYARYLPAAARRLHRVIRGAGLPLPRLAAAVEAVVRA